MAKDEAVGVRAAEDEGEDELVSMVESIAEEDGSVVGERAGEEGAGGERAAAAL
jgi:hypothetical protein